MKSSFSSRGFAPLISLVLVAALALAVPLTVNFVQKAQTIRSYASDASKAGDEAWANAKKAGKSDDEARKAAENSYNSAKPPSEKEAKQDAAVDQAKLQAIKQAGDSSKVNPNTVKQIERTNGVTPSNSSTTTTATGNVCNYAGQGCGESYPEACTTSDGRSGVHSCQKRGVCSGIGGGALCGGTSMQWSCSQCVPNGQTPAAAPALPPPPSAAAISAEQQRVADQQANITKYCSGNTTCIAQSNLLVAAGNNITADGTLSKVTITTTAPDAMSSDVNPQGTECSQVQTRCNGGLEQRCENGFWGSSRQCTKGGYCNGTRCPGVAQYVPEPPKVALYTDQLDIVGCTPGKTSCLDQNTEIYCPDGKQNTVRPCSGGETCRGNGCKPISEINNPAGAAAAAQVPSPMSVKKVSDQSAESLLNKPQSSTILWNGSVATKENFLENSHTVVNGTETRMAAISRDGSEKEIPPKSKVKVNPGDKIATLGITYEVKQNGGLQTSLQKIALPPPIETNQGNILTSIKTKIDDISNSVASWILSPFL